MSRRSNGNISFSSTRRILQSVSKGNWLVRYSASTLTARGTARQSLCYCMEFRDHLAMRLCEHHLIRFCQTRHGRATTGTNTNTVCTFDIIIGHPVVHK